MRAMWKGPLTVGVMSFPVKLHTASDSHDSPFVLVHKEDAGRVGQPRRCKLDGKLLTEDDISKALILPDGRVQLISDDDLATLPDVKNRAIDVSEFVPADQVDPLLSENSYFIEPEPMSARFYALLVASLTEQNVVGMARVALRNRVELAMVRPDGNRLVLTMLKWPDQLRSPDEIPVMETASVTSLPEYKIALDLISVMTQKFDPSKFTDTYHEQVMEIAERKLVDTSTAIDSPEVPMTPTRPASVMDLGEALKQSLAVARQTNRKKPARRAAAKPKVPKSA